MAHRCTNKIANERPLWEELRKWRWLERRTALVQLLPKTGNSIVLSEHMAGPEVMFRQACAMGLEGIVCKRLDRPYTSGRSRATGSRSRTRTLRR